MLSLLMAETLGLYRRVGLRSRTAGVNSSSHSSESVPVRSMWSPNEFYPVCTCAHGIRYSNCWPAWSKQARWRSDPEPPPPPPAAPPAGHAQRPVLVSSPLLHRDESCCSRAQPIMAPPPTIAPAIGRRRRSACRIMIMVVTRAMSKDTSYCS